VLTDSHCHLTDARFDDDRTLVLARAHEAGVSRIVTIASDAEDASAAVELARAHEGVWATAGVHPHAVADIASTSIETIAALLEQPQVVAVGETGLDFHYDNAPRDVQHRWFRAHLELAAECGLPVVVHSRSADTEMIEFLREFDGRVRGVLHCFTGEHVLLDIALNAGWYVGYGGIATFARFEATELLRRVPLDRLLLETDAPYLAPVPHRGERNEPGYVAVSARRIADIRGESFEQLARATTENASALFGIPDHEPPAADR